MRAIIVDNDWVYLEGVSSAAESVIKNRLSAKNKSARYINDVEQQRWDGVYRKYYDGQKKFARTLLPAVIETCAKYGFPITVVDQRPQYGGLCAKSGLTLTPDILPGIVLEDYQQDAIRAAMSNEIGIIKCPTGAGKCLGKGVPILMYDGSIKKVEDIVVGDLLMGDDSTARTVLSICSGEEQLYRVNQKNGDSYVVNESHILSLKRTPSKKRKPDPQSNYTATHLDRSVIDINVLDYINSGKTQKHLLKGYKVPVSFKHVPTPIDPYLFGLWLGDGISTDLQFSVGELDNVPDVFKINSEDVRLQLLAGFIDADGHVDEHCTVTIVHRRMCFIHDIVFIARSLGFRVSLSETYKQCTTTGRGDVYYRVVISGDVDRIPCKLPRKQSRPRRSKKDSLVCGISVEPIGVGEYFGFTIDGNKRFLLGDFTVTHNTELIAAIAKLYGRSTVIIADIRVVIEQIKERMDLRDVIGNNDEVGLFYGGSTPSGQKVVVGSIQSLTTPPASLKRKNEHMYKVRLRRARQFQEIVKHCGLLMVDECDKASSKPYRNLFRFYFKGRHKYGFSATPFDPDKPVDNLIIEEHMGPVIYEVSRAAVQETGRIIPIKFYAIVVESSPTEKPDSRAFDIAEREDVIDNEAFHDRIKKIVDAFPYDGTLILVDTSNVEDLGKALESKIPNSKFIYGKTTKTQRTKYIKAFESRELKCLIGGKILKRGLDLKGGAENLIIIGGGKLWSNFDQKIGRAVRKNARGWARVFNFYFRTNKYLYEHSRKQLKALVDMGYDSTVVFKHAKVDGAAFVKSRFRRPK